MDLVEFIGEHRQPLLEQWRRKVLEGYSAEAGRIFGRQQDRFANPIGYTVERGLADLLACLLDGDRLPAEGALEMIRVRAVQELAPSTAVGFIYQLLPLVEARLNEQKVTVAATELARFGERVTRVALHLFDLYMDCRERLYKVRLREIESNRFVLTDHARCPSKFLKKEDGGAACSS